jgi:hypothetical protein
MPTNIPGNPANFPANIRAPSGSDARNSTTEAAALQDLADRTAYLKTQQTVLAFGNSAPASAIAYSNATTTPTTIISSSALNVTGLAGKTIRISLGGVSVTAAAGSYTASVDAYLTFNDSVPTSSHAGSIPIVGGSSGVVCIGHDFVIPAGATTCVVSLMGTGNAAGTLYARGVISMQWLQWSIIQIPA